jgi:hypothetical protein
MRVLTLRLALSADDDDDDDDDVMMVTDLAGQAQGVHVEGAVGQGRRVLAAQALVAHQPLAQAPHDEGQRHDHHGHGEDQAAIVALECEQPLVEGLRQERQQDQQRERQAPPCLPSRRTSSVPTHNPADAHHQSPRITQQTHIISFHTSQSTGTTQDCIILMRSAPVDSWR